MAVNSVHPLNADWLAEQERHVMELRKRNMENVEAFRGYQRSGLFKIRTSCVMGSASAIIMLFSPTLLALFLNAGLACFQTFLGLWAARMRRDAFAYERRSIAIGQELERDWQRVQDNFQRGRVAHGTLVALALSGKPPDAPTAHH